MKKIFYPLFILAIAVCIALASLDSKNESFQIVEAGAPMASIVVGKEASSIERYAAKELQRAIRLMTDVELPILPPGESAKSSIIIGTPESTPLVKAQFFTEGNEEEVYIHREGRKLFLAGASPRAALYAVYTYLDETLGARWYWPGAEGEYLPRHASITVSDLTIRQIPSIEYRTLALNIVDEETDTWMARNRMNVHSYPPSRMPQALADARKQKGFLSRIASHNVTLPNEILQQHPEYVAMVKGRRYVTPIHAPHLCWSNPGVQDEIVKRISSWWEEKPDLDIIHFYPADHGAFCECPACVKMAPDISTRWQKFSAEVMKKLDVIYPGKRYWTYAYSGYRPPPKAAPADFDYIGYATYRASYRHLLSEGNKANKVLKDELSGWLRQGGKMGVRGYEFLTFREPMFVPLLPWVVDQVKWMKNLGMNGYISEVEPYNHVAAFIEKDKRGRLENRQWVGNRMALYAAARALWNADLTADQIREDWSQRIFGAASAPMQEYYRQMEQAWMRPGSIELGNYQHAVGTLVDTFITSDLLAKTGDTIDRAAAMLQDQPKTDERARAITQLQLEAKMLEKWRATFSFHQDQAESVRRFATRQKEADTDWSNAEFQPLRGQGKNGASAAFQWDENALHVRVVGNHGSAVQLDLEVDPISNRSFRLIAGLENAVKVEELPNGFDTTPRSSDGFSVKAVDDRRGRGMDIVVPFEALQCRPTAGDEWRVVARTIAGGAGTDEDNLTPYRPSAQEVLKFVNHPKHLIFFDNGQKNTALNVTIQDRGWKTTRIRNDEAKLKTALLENPSCVLIRYEDKLALSSQCIKENLQQYMENGGMVILSATKAFPADQWFAPGEVEWVGESVLRWGKHLPAGTPRWQSQPNDLTRIFSRGRVPKSAFKTTDPTWRKLVQVQTESQGNFPYLLRKPVGRGAVILTTLPIAYGGGYAMFGEQYVPDVAMLLENLSSFPPNSR